MMKAVEIARIFAKHEQVPDAQNAYMLALKENNGEDPEVDFEAASYIFYTGGKYQIAYTYFQKLYNAGHYQNELFDLMVNAFYAPNIKLQRDRYQRNCKVLANYPYLFRKDFLDFDDLPIKFFPFNEQGFLPFYAGENRFGGYVNFNHPVIDRNFFHDLEKPIFAADVYSQYQLEYLNDNVRKSEWAARENHIYLHYTDWSEFCSHLQCLDFRALLKSEKLVFLIEEEERLYPIDFKEKFGIDYSENTVKPFSPREVQKLIWHTQLATHNGGDFFNEIFHGHPNLLSDTSIMFESVQKSVASLRESIQHCKGDRQALRNLADDNHMDYRIVNNLALLHNLTDKDLLVGIFLGDTQISSTLDPNSRIAPALFFQPHFGNMLYTLTKDSEGQAVLDSEQYDAIRSSPLFLGFKYIKTFTPMRRITTSYAATVKFMNRRSDEDQEKEKTITVMADTMSQRLLNRSFMIDWQDRLYKDSVLVRFEDAKLNHKATFTALAAFLDLPFTPSMMYCSDRSGINPDFTKEGSVIGFDTATVYRTYDEYANDEERYFLEYFLRDAYEIYGYDFQYYDGAPVDEEKVKELIAHFTTLNSYIKKTWRKLFMVQFPNILKNGEAAVEADMDMIYDSLTNQKVASFDDNRLKIAQVLLEGLYFINRNEQPLRMMPLLKLDPALLQQPLYH